MNAESLDLREVLIKSQSGKAYDGYFHGWFKEPYLGTVALIERTTGVMEFIEPVWITFKKPYTPKQPEFPIQKD